MLDEPGTVAEFWEITRDPEFGWDLEDVAVGPTVIVVPLPDAERYVARYSEPDKIAFGMDVAEHWPVRFWDVDAAMSCMLMLLAAVDLGSVGGSSASRTAARAARSIRRPSTLRPIDHEGSATAPRTRRRAGRG